MRRCNKCGFPLGVRPGMFEEDGVCGACINAETKKTINFKERQEWLTKYIADNKTHAKYDCLVAVSGGKDSHAIVRRLYEKHGVKNALLVTVTDEFSHTQAGLHNINNLVMRYNCDHITFRCEPITFREKTLEDFVDTFHPLKWIEEKIYSVPLQIARAFGIKLVFFGENSDFEYGSTRELGIFHPASDDTTKIIFMGAIWPYSIADSLNQAVEIGFEDLDDTKEWDRKGSIDQYTQIDSVGYLVQLWTKYVKYGFQRVTDIACRFVRDGILTREQAIKLIDARDYIFDPKSKDDFCRTIGITHDYFDKIVAVHANKNIVEKRDGAWHALP